MIYYAMCPSNQEDLVEAEARSAGAVETRTATGGVLFRGSLASGYRFCLWSRTATRLLAMIHRTTAETVDEFYERSVSLPWENYLTTETTFAISQNVSSCPWLDNDYFAAVRLKDAIADRMREKCGGERPSVDLDDPDIGFALRIDGTEVSYFVEFSGKGLSRRGYRLAQTEACLAEHLAASAVLRSPWWKGGMKGAFVDPFCGSGTLCVEAALLATNTAPGLLDPFRFAFHKLPFHDEALFNDVLKEADEAQVPAQCEITGYDLDPEAIEISRRNAKAAGVDDIVRFERADFLKSKETAPPAEGGFIVADPPYGLRMGRDRFSLERLYRGIGETLVRCYPGWSASVLCGDPGLLDCLLLKPDCSNVLFNGGLRCVLAHYRILTPDERAALEEKAAKDREERLALPLSEGGQAALNRLRKNMEALRPALEEEGVTCYRLYDADMPDYAAAIDIYEGKWVSLQEYAAPESVDPEAAQRRLRELVLATERATGVDLRNIHVKQRKVQKGEESQYERSSSPKGDFHLVGEGGLRFLVNFTDHLDTGLFLDHRPVRERIRGLARARRFLNLFCYTATATVYAAAGGALSTVSVDASATYLEWGRKNMRNNGFDGLNHFYYLDDVFSYLAGTRDRYDLIFCDPPTFSNGTGRRDFDIQYDHSRLIKAAMAHLENDGLMIFSTNFRRFKMDPYIEEIFDVRDITEETIGEDYARSGRIHQCWEIRKRPLRPVGTPIIRLKASARKAAEAETGAAEAAETGETGETGETAKSAESAEAGEAVRE